jgi:hypothetical protein
LGIKNLNTFNFSPLQTYPSNRKNNAWFFALSGSYGAGHQRSSIINPNTTANLLLHDISSPLCAGHQYSALPQPKESITVTARNWLQDTKTVSSFLDYGVTFPASLPPDILKNAAEALAAELDELTHKAMLDEYFINNTAEVNQKVYFANAVLVTGGIFQFVVDSLKNIPETDNVSIVKDINVARCMWILPTIDVYFEQVAFATNQTVIELAFRPLACPVGSNLPRRRQSFPSKKCVSWSRHEP